MYNFINPNHGLGRLPQKPDARDFILSIEDPGPLPAVVDLRHSQYRPGIWNQGSLGSCTSFAAARIAQQTYGIDGYRHPFEPAHLPIYYWARNYEGTTGSDSGASMRDAMRAIAEHGICAEHWSPYSDANPGPFTQEPSAEAQANALKHLATVYKAVPQDLTTMKRCLAEGYPFMIGFEVFASFESPTANATGIIPMPDRNNERLLGGHASTVEGYNDKLGILICDNSWGIGWGDHGSYYVPYEYFLDPSLASDAWTIRTQK